MRPNKIFKKIRLKHGLTRKQLAKKINLSIHSINKIENYERIIAPNEIFAIVNGLDEKLELFMVDSERNKPTKNNDYFKKIPKEIRCLINLLENYDDEIIIKSKKSSDIKLNIHDQSMLYNYILDGYDD